MKISLVIPPFLVLPQARHWYFTSKAMGIRSLSSYLRSKGHEIQLVDGLMAGFFRSKRYLNGYVIGLDPRTIAQRVAPDADLIGVTAPFCYVAPVCHELVDNLRQRFPDRTIVMGGVYPTTQPQLALTAPVDYVVVGEGEIPIERLAAGENPSSIRGVYSRESISSDAFVAAECVSDLDGLPAPDTSLLIGEDAPDLSQIGQRRSSYHMIRTSRGCPFDCAFCSIHRMNGYKFRACSSEKVLRDIQEAITKDSGNHIEFDDDNFTLLKDRTVAILEGMIRLQERGYDLTWRAANGLRIDSLDEDVIRLFKRSGCTEANLALEHGDPEMLRLMNKKIDLDRAYRTFELLVKHEIPEISTFILVGYPGETRARFDNSVRYVEKVTQLRSDIIAWPFIVQPYPGTKLEAQCMAAGLIDKHTNNYLEKRHISHPEETVVIETSDFDAAEVLRRRDVIYSRFNTTYLSYARSTLKSRIRTLLPREVYYHWRVLKHKYLTR
jgi:anaerobic magnesium-protoporphyrin IX monomethyl ester cyclase